MDTNTGEIIEKKKVAAPASKLPFGASLVPDASCPECGASIACVKVEGKLHHVCTKHFAEDLECYYAQELAAPSANEGDDAEGDSIGSAATLDTLDEFSQDSGADLGRAQVKTFSKSTEGDEASSRGKGKVASKGKKQR